MHRFTKKECEELTDYIMLYHLANDRWGNLSGFNSPLAKRLEQLMHKLNDKKRLTR